MKRLKRALAFLLCMIMAVSAMCFVTPVGALDIDERLELRQLIGCASNTQSILAITNEYQNTLGFKMSAIYSGISAGSDTRNFLTSILSFSTKKASERIQKDIYEQEKKIIQEVIFKSDIEFKDEDAEILKRWVKVYGKIKSLDYLSICATDGEVTNENKEQFKNSLKKIMPEIRDAFPNIDDGLWGKLIGDLDTVDIIGIGLDGVTAVEKICYAITTCDANIELLEKMMNHIPHDSKLYSLLDELKNDIKSGWDVTFWNQYLKDKAVNEVLKKAVKFAGEKIPGVALVSSTLSCTSFLNGAIFKWLLNTPSINDWVVAIDMCGHVSVLGNITNEVDRKIATNTASDDEILQALNDSLIAIEMCNATLQASKSFAKYNKQYNVSFVDNEINENEKNKTLIINWANRIMGSESVDTSVDSNNANINSNEVKTVQIESGIYYIVSSLDSNKALEVADNSKYSKANIQLYDFNYKDNQKFSIQQNGNYYSIVNVNSEKAVDVSGGHSSSKTNLWQYDYNGSDAQKWKFILAGDGYYYIQSALGTYIDAQDGKSENGTNVWMYQYNGTAAQKWKLVKSENVHNHDWVTGTEKAHPHRNYKYCDECGEKTYTDDGNYRSSCDECNPDTECVHNWNYYNKSSHPHKEYRECSKCGEVEYTGNTGYESSCSKCNVCNHSWNYYNESAHPHKEYKECSKCGETKYTGATGSVDSCGKCHPVTDSEMTRPCEHNWKYYTESSHPHEEYKKCTSCGEKVYTGATEYKSNCSICNPPDERYWRDWSDWSTSYVESSETRQVQTKTQYVYYHYLLTYDDNNVGTYPINMATANYNFRNFVNAHVKAESYHEFMFDSPMTVRSGGVQYTVNGSVKGFDRYDNVCTQDHGNFNGNLNGLFYKGTVTVYRYRDFK